MAILLLVASAPPAAEADAPVVSSPVAVTKVPWGSVQVDAGGFRFAIGAFSLITPAIQSAAAFDAKPGFTHLIVAIGIENLQTDRRAPPPVFTAEILVPEGWVTSGCEPFGDAVQQEDDNPGLCVLELDSRTGFRIGEDLYSRAYEPSEAVVQVFGTKVDAVAAQSVQVADAQVRIRGSFSPSTFVLPLPRSIDEVQKFSSTATGGREEASSPSSTSTVTAVQPPPTTAGRGRTEQAEKPHSTGRKLKNAAAWGVPAFVGTAAAGCVVGAATVGGTFTIVLPVIGTVAGAAAGCLLVGGVTGLGAGLAGAVSGFLTG